MKGCLCAWTGESARAHVHGQRESALTNEREGERGKERLLRDACLKVRGFRA